MNTQNALVEAMLVVCLEEGVELLQANCWGVISVVDTFFILLSLFKKNEYAYEMKLLSVCVCIPPIVASQRLGKNPLIVSRQRLGRNVTAVTNTQATIEELLDASFSMWPVSYQGK
jgi:hypothetical protein